jgi:hypothetical protein
MQVVTDRPKSKRTHEVVVRRVHDGKGKPVASFSVSEPSLSTEHIRDMLRKLAGRK